MWHSLFVFLLVACVVVSGSNVQFRGDVEHDHAGVESRPVLELVNVKTPTATPEPFTIQFTCNTLSVTFQNIPLGRDWYLFYFNAILNDSTGWTKRHEFAVWDHTPKTVSMRIFQSSTFSLYGYIDQRDYGFLSVRKTFSTPACRSASTARVQVAVSCAYLALNMTSYWRYTDLYEAFIQYNSTANPRLTTTSVTMQDLIVIPIRKNTPYNWVVYGSWRYPVGTRRLLGRGSFTSPAACTLRPPYVTVRALSCNEIFANLSAAFKPTVSVVFTFTPLQRSYGPSTLTITYNEQGISGGHVLRVRQGTLYSWEAVADDGLGQKWIAGRGTLPMRNCTGLTNLAVTPSCMGVTYNFANVIRNTDINSLRIKIYKYGQLLYQLSDDISLPQVFNSITDTVQTQFYVSEVVPTNRLSWAAIVTYPGSKTQVTLVRSYFVVPACVRDCLRKNITSDNVPAIASYYHFSMVCTSCSTLVYRTFCNTPVAMDMTITDPRGVSRGAAAALQNFSWMSEWYDVWTGLRPGTMYSFLAICYDAVDDTGQSEIAHGTFTTPSC